MPLLRGVGETQSHGEEGEGDEEGAPGSGLNPHVTCLNILPSLWHQERGKQKKGWG